MDRKAQRAVVHWVLKSRTRLSDWTEPNELSVKEGFPGGSDSKESICNTGDLGLIPGQEDLLEDGVATHSSILAWSIPMDRGA